MAESTVPRLYTETRLNLDPAYDNSIVELYLPPLNTDSPSRTALTRRPIDGGEDSFGRKHLASDASVFFRRKSRYPRSFLWRVLDDRGALEIQSVDLSKDTSSAKGDEGVAELTLLLKFPDAIKPFGVAFADPDEKDALHAFVITKTNQLYTLNLHKDFFIKQSVGEGDIAEWCKIYTASSFSFRMPYRLFAVSAHELYVSVHDGGILQLKRQPGADGSHWRESYFNRTGWGSSFRGLIPWKSHNTVRFGNLDLEGESAASVALSPDGAHFFTVCLDHTLRAWSIEHGTVKTQTDLLGAERRDPQKAAHYLIGPAQRQMMQLVDITGPNGELYYIVTYSPKHHQFKFWGISDPEASNGIRDQHSGICFIPPVHNLMDTSVWNLEEFYIKAGKRWEGTVIWIRARSGAVSKTFTLIFDLFFPSQTQSELETVWEEDWVEVNAGPLTVEALKDLLPAEIDQRNPPTQSASVSEQWLDFLFFPGRFSRATLETAFHVYLRGLGAELASRQKSNVALKEQVFRAVASKTRLERTDAGALSYDNYELDLSGQWQAFYSLVRDLHKRRGETLSLAYDEVDDLPWSILADYACPIRKLSEVELLYVNNETLTNVSDAGLAAPLVRSLQDTLSVDLAPFLAAARRFRMAFDSSFHRTLKHFAATEALQDPSHSIPVRMQLFDERCNLSAQVSDDDLAKLEDGLEEIGGIQEVGMEKFDAVLTRLGELEQGSMVHKTQTSFGGKILVRGAQEYLTMSTDILLDLLVFVVFASMDLEQAELADDFDGAELYVAILVRLKENAILSWLANATHTKQHPRRRTSGVENSTLTRSKMSEASRPRFASSARNLMLDIFEFPSKLHLSGEMPPTITYWIRSWTLGPSSSEGCDSIAVSVMGSLLKDNSLDLAADFLQFLPSTPWATYLRGRLHLGLEEHTTAAVYFKKASFGLSLGYTDIDHEDSANLLQPHERALFSDTAASYYQHVISLYEKAKAFSFVADFAKLALQSACMNQEQDSGIKTDILSRLLTASIQTARFEDAYSALTLNTDHILRQKQLETLIKSMISASQVPALLALPFATLSSSVDAILASLCATKMNITTGPPYHQILYAYRIAHNDFRGAAAALQDRLQKLQSTTEATRDPQDETVVQAHLMLVNALAVVEPKQAWVLAEGKAEEAAGPFGGPAKKRRRIVTIDDARREYQAELDRVAAIENGQFAYAEGDGIDVL